MQKLNDASEMMEGKVYNLVYVGSNEAYAKINGKRTIRVTATTPQLEYVQLYSRFVSPISHELCSDTIFVRNPSAAFKEDEIFEPENETEWFKHSAKVTKLSEGIEQGILTSDDIRKHPVLSNRSPFTSVSGKKGEFLGLYTSFEVEDRTSQPFLQSVYVWWDTWEKMYAEFKEFGIDARR